MQNRKPKCARKAAIYGLTICLIMTMIPIQVMMGQDTAVSPQANSYAIAGTDSLGTGSVLDSPEDGTDATGSLVRSWILLRSNEIATESEVTGVASPMGIGQTTDLVDDGSGSIGRSWVDHGFSTDCAGFSVWAATAPWDNLIIEVAQNSSNGGYSTSCDIELNTNDYLIGDLPTNGGFVPLHKIGGVFGTGTPGVDYFTATRASGTSTVLAWPDHPDEWGNIYGYRVFRQSSSEPWHSISNLTSGNGTTGFTDNTCLATKAYNYSIALLYRGMQSGVQNTLTAVESLFRSYAVESLPLLTVTPTPADGAMGVSVSTSYILMFSRAMNTSLGNVSITPAPTTGGAWAWDVTGIYYNYTGAAWTDLTKYYVNLTNFADLSGNSISGDRYFNFTTTDSTDPTSVVTGPMTANTLTFPLQYTYSDPSGVSRVQVWMTSDNGTNWALMGTDEPPTGSFSVTVPADGIYHWYTAAQDSLSNEETTPPVGPAFIEFMTLVDTVDPVIGITTADKIFINNQGTYGGATPPVMITTNVTDANLAMAGWGIRNENFVGNSTIYFQSDIANDTMPSTQAWDGSWYFVDGTLVTGGMCMDWFNSTSIFVMGELNGNTTEGGILGYLQPSHYSLYDPIGGASQAIYNTMGTPMFYDDALAVLSLGDTFRAYRYDEGIGYLGTAVHQTYTGIDWLNLTIAPIPDGRYTVAVTGIDMAQNIEWTNEADGNPVITVDTVAPTVALTLPAAAATGVVSAQDIVITFSERMDTASVAFTVTPNPGNLNAVWSVNDTVLTITHDPFAQLTFYNVSVTAAMDLTGNNMIPGAVPNPWEFTTGDFEAPTADAGLDQTVNEDIIVTFNGSLSADNVGIANYTWTFNDSISDVTLYGVAPVHIFAQPGNYTVTLNVTDSVGNWDIDTMWVLVLDVTPPTANAGVDQIVNEGATVTFDGSASTDNVGVVNYTWTFFDGAANITLYGVSPAHQFTVVGVFTVTLTVRDSVGLTGNDTMTVEVLDSTAPAANAGPDQTVNESSIVTFNGSASTDNIGITNYTWTFNDGAANIVIYGVAPTHLFAIPGVYTVTLNVTDSESNWGTDVMVVTVLDTTPPTANAGVNQTVNEGTTVTFDGSASSDNVGVVNYTWTFFDGAANITLYGTGPAHQFNVVGIYDAILTVRDAAGYTGNDSMRVTVLDSTAPIANAGPDQTVNESTAVTFNGSASTDNIGIVNYTWTFNDGAANIMLYGLAPTHLFAIPGVYTVTLNVTDSESNWNTDTMTVTVIDITLPTAEAGVNQTVNEGTTVTFDGSASSDNVGVVNYTWVFYDGAANITLYGPGPAHQFNVVGIFNVILTIRDAAGNAANDTMTVTVLDITLPTANAGPDQTVGEDTLMAFDGTASTDNVGVVNYTWTFTDGVAVTLWGATPGYNFTIPGIYTVTLTVRDAAGNSDTDTLTVTVTDITGPTANAGADETIDEGDLLIFDGSASTDNIGIVNYTWTFTDGTPVILWGISPFYQFLNVGIFTVTLNVTDNEGNWDLDTMTVTVRDITEPIALAGPDQTVDEDANVNFDGSASTDNIGIVNYTWSLVDGTPISLWGVSPTYIFSTPGVYLIALTVYDAAGNSDTDTLTVTVNDITPPTSNAGPDQSVNEGSTVTFAGGASMDNLGIANYTWTFTDGTPVTLWGANPIHQFNSIGSFTVMLTVRDAAGNSDTDTMSVIVNDATAPAADAGPDQAVNQGAAVTFDGAASTDNVGVSNYTWTFTDGAIVTLWGASPSHIFNSAGTFTVTLTVRDAAGNSDTDTMTVTVTDNTAPTADAGADQTISAGSTVTFDGSASTDNVAIVNFTWTFTDGATVTLYGMTPDYQFNNAGTVTVTLTVSDAMGNTDNDTMNVTVQIFTVDYIRIETLATGGVPVGTTVITTDQTLTVWAIGYSNLGGRLGPVNVLWSTAGTLDIQTGTLDNFAFSPVHAVTNGVIIASYGMLTAVSGLITVNPGATVGYNITAAPSTLSAGGTFLFQTFGYDQEWNPTGPVAVTWSISAPGIDAGTSNGTISSSGLFMPVITADWTITATHALGDRTDMISVVPGALAYILVNPNYSVADAGDATALAISGFDAYGNDIDTLTGATVWYLDGTIQASGSITSNTAGNHTVFANYFGFLGIAYINVSASAGNRIVIGQTGISITADQTFAFSVSILDAFGNAVTGTLPAITWRAGNGTVVSGLFTPWSSGTWTVYANATGYTGGTATITVTSGSVARIVISPSGTGGTRALEDISAGQSRLFTVSALDQRDNLVSVPSAYLEWTTTAGTVSNGFFTALTNLNGAQVLSGILSVVYDDGTAVITNSESINVTVGDLHHIVIESTDEVSLNEYLEFTANGYDIYGNMITGLAFTWGISDDIGDIESDGVFHGTERGMGTVTATSGGITGSMPVFVSEPAGIFANWLWLVIILFIVVIILVVLLIIGRRKELVVVREEEPEEEIPEEEEEELPEEEVSEEPEEEPEMEDIPEDIIPEDIPSEPAAEGISEVPDEFNEPLADLEKELAFEELEEEEIPPEKKGPEMTPAKLKAQLAEEMRVDRCEKMLSAAVVLPEDKEKLRTLIAGGISAQDFTAEVEKAIEKRKKREKEKDVTADEKASILEDELVAELAELEDQLDGGSEEDLEDQILKEIEDLEDM